MSPEESGRCPAGMTRPSETRRVGVLKVDKVVGATTEVRRVAPGRDPNGQTKVVAARPGWQEQMEVALMRTPRGRG